MSDLIRFGISLDKGLLEKFDRLIKAKDYHNRSEAIRDLIRLELVRKEWAVGREVAGAITLVYDHHKRDLVNKLTDIQHDSQAVVLSTQHIHLDHSHCLEIIAVKGRPKDVEKLAQKIKSTKGVMHSDLTMTTTGRNLT